MQMVSEEPRPDHTHELACALEKIRNLEVALTTNRRIGMALGVLMARHNLTDEQAFAMLVRASHRRHRKVREIADDVVLTGELDDVAA